MSEALLADAEAKTAALGDPWDKVLASPEGSPERKAAEEVVTALQALGKGLTEAGAKARGAGAHPVGIDHGAAFRKLLSALPLPQRHCTLAAAIALALRALAML